MPAHTKNRDFSGTPTRIVIFLFAALTLIALMGIALSNNPETKNDKKPLPITKEIINISPHTLIYGTWSANSSLVIAYDLSTGKEGIIASLPANIKKVTVISPDSLLFINNTDDRDHGQEIVQYSLTSQKSSVIYRASDGFGIDDYVLSPNFKRLAVWEIQVNAESGTVMGGKSRVYTALTGESGRNIIYDEAVTPSNPVRYPQAILDNGTVFMDRFLPNSGAGWAYGMSISNFIGTQKEDIAVMQNGTYGTRPVLSPDGKYLAFAGYTGSNGDGKSEFNGFRRALVYPNTVEILDVTTLERERLVNLPQNRIYSSVAWNNDSNNLLFTIQAPTEQNSGLYNYMLENNSLQPIVTPAESSDEYLIQDLSSTAQLIGVHNTNPTATGNLGSTYATPYLSFSIYNPQTKEVTQLSTVSNLMQLIGVFPATSFGSFQSIIARKQEEGNDLQITTYQVKSQLAPIRTTQQTHSAECNNDSCSQCIDLTTVQCEETNYHCFNQEFFTSKNIAQCY